MGGAQFIFWSPGSQDRSAHFIAAEEEEIARYFLKERAGEAVIEAPGAILHKDALHHGPNCGVALDDLSWLLQFVHGLQPALDQLRGAQGQRRERGRHGAGGRGLQVTQLGLLVQSHHFLHKLLAEAVAHEEDGVLGDVGHERGAGALVEAAQAHLRVRLAAAVGEALVQGGERLHLHFHGVEGLPGQDTRGAPEGPRREVDGRLDDGAELHVRARVSVEGDPSERCGGSRGRCLPGTIAPRRENPLSARPGPGGRLQRPGNAAPAAPRPADPAPQPPSRRARTRTEDANTWVRTTESRAVSSGREAGLRAAVPARVWGGGGVGGAVLSPWARPRRQGAQRETERGPKGPSTQTDRCRKDKQTAGGGRQFT